MKLEISIQDLLDSIDIEDSMSKIEMSETNPAFTSSNFSEKNNLLKSLMKVQPTFNSQTFNVSAELGKPIQNQVPIGTDKITIYSSWKNIENISARLIECYDNIVVLECLLDRDLQIYQEREFRASLFQGYELKIGNLFYLRFFDRRNETRMEIHNDPNLTNEKDFPKKDFTQFSTSKLFKNKP